MPSQRCYYYQDLMLPVLLDSLRGGWQANELVRPLAKLKAMDGNGLLRRTLNAWFRNIANRLKNDYILCPDMRQRSIAGCYQNNVAWL